MTDEELKTLVDKVDIAIKLENPKARYACYFFAGESSKDDKLRTSAAVKATPVDMLAAIDGLLNDLEKAGVSRNVVLINLLSNGPIQKECW